MQVSRRLALASLPATSIAQSRLDAADMVADIASFLGTLAMLAVEDPQEAERIGGPLLDALETAEAQAHVALRHHYARFDKERDRATFNHQGA